jgi:hypothetical protein
MMAATRTPFRWSAGRARRRQVRLARIMVGAVVIAITVALVVSALPGP